VARRRPRRIGNPQPAGFRIRSQFQRDFREVAPRRMNHAIWRDGTDHENETETRIFYPDDRIVPAERGGTACPASTAGHVADAIFATGRCAGRAGDIARRETGAATEFRDGLHLAPLKREAPEKPLRGLVGSPGVCRHAGKSRP